MSCLKAVKHIDCTSSLTARNNPTSAISILCMEYLFGYSIWPKVCNYLGKHLFALKVFQNAYMYVLLFHLSKGGESKITKYDCKEKIEFDGSVSVENGLKRQTDWDADGSETYCSL